MTPTAYARNIYAALPAGLSLLAYIGGGCFRSLYDHSPVKDVDLFFGSYEDFQCACDFFTRDPRFTELQSGCNGGRIFSDGVNPPYNLVGFRFHKSATDLMRDFDFTCVTCVAEVVAPDEIEITQGTCFASDATSKTLRFNKVQNHARAVKRVARYESYGYTRARGFAFHLARSVFIPAPIHGGDY